MGSRLKSAEEYKLPENRYIIIIMEIYICLLLPNHCFTQSALVAWDFLPLALTLPHSTRS